MVLENSSTRLLVTHSPDGKNKSSIVEMIRGPIQILADRKKIQPNSLKKKSRLSKINSKKKTNKFKV